MSMPENFDGPAAAATSPATQESSAPSPETPALSAPSGPAAAPAPRNKWTSTTYLLIIANTVIFFAMLEHSIYLTGVDSPIGAYFDSGLSRMWGSDFGPLTLSGQFWRVVTSLFIHANFSHLGWNMLFLWGFGRYLDRLFTRIQTLAIYLLTGVASSIFSLSWHPLAISAGSSGAIYGQAGVLIALLCFARFNFSRRDIRNLLLWIFFSMPIGLLWGHVSKDADYAGHIGGILCGFGIGVLLAQAFRLSPAEQAARQRKIWQFATLVLVFGFGAVTQAHRSTVLKYLDVVDLPASTTAHFTNQDQPVAKRIFLDLKGDPKLARHFSGLLHAELENSGITVMSSAPEADAVAHGEIRGQRDRIYIRMGVIQMYIKSKSGLQKISSCDAFGTGENYDLFSQSEARQVVEEIRHHDPDARTVLLDPKSDMSASSEFAKKLPSELEKSDFTVVQSGPADVALHVALLPQKAPVDEDVADYDITVVAKNGEQIFASSGEKILFAKLAGDVPAACSNSNLADLGWLYNNAALYSVASEIADNLYNLQNTPRAQKPASKSK